MQMSEPSQASGNCVLSQAARVSRPDPDQECRHIHGILSFYQFWLHLYMLFPAQREQHFIVF